MEGEVLWGGGGERCTCARRVVAVAGSGLEDACVEVGGTRVLKVSKVQQVGRWRW